MKCVEVYKELYHQEPFDVAFCPYRISPLGAHIDHQYGKINGLAIDKGIHMAYHPKQNGVVELQSLNFPKRAQFFVSAVPEEKQGDWADHLRGAAKMLGEKYRLKVGLSGIIEGSLPIGGLSSSASVIICFLSALCKVNGIHLEPMEMILTAKAAENQYVGVSCGKLDQSCEVLSKKNHLLYLDTKDDSYELIPTSEKMKPYKVAIFFSGLERSLKNSKYNLRQDECKAAAYPSLLTSLLISLHNNKPVYRLPQQSIRRLAFVPPYFVFCSISFRCGGLSIERNQKPLAPKITLVATHHDRQKQVEVKRSSCVNPHEIRLFSGCPYAVVK